MADATKKSVKGPKHTMCRRVGYCLWGKPNCPTNSRTKKNKDGQEIATEGRTYPAGQHGPTKRRGKLSTYGSLLQAKQILRAYYDLGERQLRFLYEKSRQGKGVTGEKLLANLEMRLTTAVYKAGLAPTIFAARQIVSHRHILVDGKTVDRGSYRLKAGQVISINAKSPTIIEIARNNDAPIPPYFEKSDVEVKYSDDISGVFKVTVLHEPLPDEIQNGVEITKVIEYYAR